MPNDILNYYCKGPEWEREASVIEEVRENEIIQSKFQWL